MYKQNNSNSLHHLDQWVLVLNMVVVVEGVELAQEAVELQY